MRSAREVLDLVLRFAAKDENIRLVVMNGSRVNPHVKEDPFQDFDVACLVNEVEPYVQNMRIPSYFGEIMILQTPEEMSAVQTHFQKSPGTAGKYLQNDLDPALWTLLERTYSDADSEHTWEALFAMGDLFRLIARRLAIQFHYTYPEAEDRLVTGFIQHIRNLPKNAAAIY